MSQTYAAFTSFDHLFHMLIDVVVCVIVYLQYRFVVKIGRLEYLRWVYPAAFASGITLIWRIIVNLHFFLRLHFNQMTWMTLDTWFDVGDISSIMGSIIFLRMMLSGNLFTSAPSGRVRDDADAWPPAPTQD